MKLFSKRKRADQAKQPKLPKNHYLISGTVPASIIISKKLVVNFYDWSAAYLKVTNSSKFITYDRLMASVLLKCAMGFNDPIYLAYVKSSEKALKQRADLVYGQFILGFQVNYLAPNHVLTPSILKEVRGNHEHFDFINSNDQDQKRFYDALNHQIAELLTQNIYLELLPKVVVYYSNNSNQFKCISDHTHWALR